MESNVLEYEKKMNTQKSRVRGIRITVDSLTNEVIAHLNKINRLLTEIEQTLVEHPEIPESLCLANNSSIIFED
ncbi:MAG: hypothetical protein NWF03_04890 [Candidatus Bathyarchaeota archaeon]|nr:hypothetical protein [Candidatus Bathyarchaeota archaeon]